MSNIFASMSSFQLYQFKSIDRLLTEAERQEIGTWSSRAKPSATSVTFTYAYGDFPKNKEKVVEKYFDAMLYLASWGERRLMFRFPKDMIDEAELLSYTFENDDFEDSISVHKCKSCYILDIHFVNDGGGDWIEEEEFELVELLPIRVAILQGDFRALYLIWLQFAQRAQEVWEDLDAESENRKIHTPPKVPTNLAELNAALKAFVDFFEIEEQVLALAKTSSQKEEIAPLDYESLIAQIPESECREWLLNLANAKPLLDISFKKRLQQISTSNLEI